MNKLIILFLAALTPTLIPALAQAEAKRPAPRLMVTEIKDRSAGGESGSCDFYRLWSTPGGAVREILIDELLKLDGVTVLEREQLSDIYDHEIGNENIEESTKVAKKKLIGANLAIAGVISEFEWCQSSHGHEIDVGSIFGLGELSVGRETSSAHVAFDLRLIDVQTGKILKTFKSSGKVDDANFSLSVDAKGVRYSNKSFEKTPLGKANRMAIADAVKQISAAIKEYR